MNQTANSRLVRVLRLHQSFLIEGYGNVPNVVNLSERKNNITLTGVIVDSGILLTAHLTAKTVDALVPWGNIVSAELFPKIQEQSQAV